MGDGRYLRCSNCNNGSILALGVGMAFPEEYKDTLKDIKDGVYGEEYKKMMLSRKDIAVDLENNLYLCEKCGEWEVNYCFDFYVPKNNGESVIKEKSCVYPYELKEGYERIFKAVHICNNCKSEMRKVEPNENVFLKCPICNSNMNRSDSIDVNWD